MVLGIKSETQFENVKDFVLIFIYSLVPPKHLESGKKLIHLPLISFLFVALSFYSCELLMRSAERELLEIERKRQSSGGIDTIGVTSSLSNSSASTKTPSEAMNQRLNDITKRINEETKRLAAVRAQLQKVKSGQSSLAASASLSSADKKEGSSSSSSANDKEEGERSIKTEKEEGKGTGKEGKKAKIEKGEGGGEGGEGSKPKGSGPRGTLHIVPESLYPSLCK
jgi:hypothetical protein